MLMIPPNVEDVHYSIHTVNKKYMNLHKLLYFSTVYTYNIFIALWHTHAIHTVSTTFHNQAGMMISFEVKVYFQHKITHNSYKYRGRMQWSRLSSMVWISGEWSNVGWFNIYLSKIQWHVCMVQGWGGRGDKHRNERIWQWQFKLWVAQNLRDIII